MHRRHIEGTERLFRLRRVHKPDRDTDDERRADPFRIMPQRTRSEGAFPMTTIEPRSDPAGQKSADVRVIHARERCPPVIEGAEDLASCPRFRMPVCTILISVMIGAPGRVRQGAATGSPTNRIRSAIVKSRTATEHRCRIRSSGVAFPTRSRARFRLVLAIA